MINVIRKDLRNFRGEAWLIKLDDTEHVKNQLGDKAESKYFVVSPVPETDTYDDAETMIFESDENGVVDNWLTVIMVPEMNHEKAIAELAKIIER